VGRRGGWILCRHSLLPGSQEFVAKYLLVFYIAQHYDWQSQNESGKLTRNQHRTEIWGENTSGRNRTMHPLSLECRRKGSDSRFRHAQPCQRSKYIGKACDLGAERVHVLKTPEERASRVLVFYNEILAEHSKEVSL
jgi:hypothetical protein